ncbi:MAG: response regulator transcription factor [Actinomycetota bacterium]|nr:response regulator transcription factor [Actinomycetota bacterium]
MTDFVLPPSLYAVRVLLVEDDADLAGPLADALRRRGLDVSTVRTAREVLARAGQPEVDVVLLDLDLPDADGLEVCRILRQRTRVPILMTSARTGEHDRVLGLEVGADDYVVKPFGFEELLARVRALLRRCRWAREDGSPGSVEVRRDETGSAEPGPSSPGTADVPSLDAYGFAPPRQDLGRLVIDRRERRVLLDGDEVALTLKEFELLDLLCADPGALVRRERIMESVWDAHYVGSTKTLDVHVAALRRKLADREWIETVRGAGFRLGRPALAAPPRAADGSETGTDTRIDAAVTLGTPNGASRRPLRCR